MPQRNDILLSICIPTRNRKELLLKLVNECLDIADERVEIVVSDNASDDGTETALRAIHNDRLHYVRNKENIGGANILECLFRGNGKFRMLIRDKDTIGRIQDFHVILDRLQQADENTTFLGTLKTPAGEFIAPPQPQNKKDTVASYYNAMSYAMASAAIFPGKLVQSEVPKVKANSAYLLSIYPHSALLAYCVHNGDALPLPELDIWQQAPIGELYFDTKGWTAAEKEPYWTISSRKTLSLEWIHFFRDFSMPDNLNSGILVNIALKYTNFWMRHAFNVIYFPNDSLLKAYPQIILHYQKKSITEWHYLFWDGFYSLDAEIASIYGISIITPHVMNIVKSHYNQFCQQTAAKEGVEMTIK